MAAIPISNTKNCNASYVYANDTNEMNWLASSIKAKKLTERIGNNLSKEVSFF
jgi:hypothetical protein